MRRQRPPRFLGAARRNLDSGRAIPAAPRTPARLLHLSSTSASAMTPRWKFDHTPREPRNSAEPSYDPSASA
eukprot:2722927-Alexandrium_andersonii.AAC.1